MKCVILQPSYIPWRGYFHQIAKADLFVFYDDVQYDRRGWRNRNKIKTASGSQWLTIPVHAKGVQQAQTAIQDIQIVYDDDWNDSHWKSISMAYQKAPFFDDYASLIYEFYQRKPAFLADFTIETTIALAYQLGIRNTDFVRSSSLGVDGAKTDRLINILQKVGATDYISGPSAQAYIEEEKFNTAGITLEYMSYNYPAYPQLYPPFDPQVSILDLLFMTGTDAMTYFTGGAKVL